MSTGFCFRTALLPEGWADSVRVLVDGGRITSIERQAPPQPQDQQGDIAIPGMPNLHSHAFQRAMAGLTEVRGPTADSFWTWRDLMYRFVGRIGPEELEAIAALAFVEMLEAGFTRVGEFHYLHHAFDGSAYENSAEMAERVAAAAETSGIGLTLLPVFYAHGGFGAAPLAPAQRRFRSDLDGYARLLESSRAAVARLENGTVGVAPHSLRAVTEAELREVSAMGGPVHIHIAEQTKEVEDCHNWSGSTPVEWLLQRFDVGPRWCLVHATHMTGQETADLAASGAVAGLCPITEANLGDGVFPAPEYLAGGGAFGVGSDSNVRIDASEELRLLEYGQRLTKRERAVLACGERASTGAHLYWQALEGGSQALGGGQAGLAVGQSADIVLLDGDHPDLASREGDALLDAFVFAGGARLVKDVWRAGRRVVADGRHVSRAAVAARYRQTLEGLVA